MAKNQVQMRTREEIEAIALELYPVRLDFHKNDTNQSNRAAFVLGWQMEKEYDTMTESALNMGRTLSMRDDNEYEICG